MKARTQAQKLRRKRGRPLTAGIREPNGRVSRSGIDHTTAHHAPIKVRAQQLGISQEKAMNQKAGSFIGYLNLIGPRDGLSEAQYEGAQSYLTFRQRVLRAIKSPEAIYDPEAVGAGGDITEQYEDWCKETLEEWDDLKKQIQTEQNGSRENLWAALQYVLIEDQRLHHMIGATRVLSNVLARHFKTAQTNRRAA
jgi:hypothetical protein